MYSLGHIGAPDCFVFLLTYNNNFIIIYHLLFTREPCYNVPPQRVTIELCLTCLNSFSSTIIYYETTAVELMHFLMQNGSHRIKVSYKIEHKLHVSFGILDHLQ